MTEGHSFTFPDESRGELDKALNDLMSRARDVLTTQGRLRALLRANQAIIEHLELPVVLERIVEAAVELVGAKYGALGVVSPEGGLEQFINVGMSPHVVEQIGHLPEGHGLLGALIDDPRPIRIPVLSDHPMSVGFPAHHPAMSSFLGVPIRVGDAVYGNLYLSNQASGEFSEEDEQLVTALAATAGIAIENARLFAETHRRQAWASASAEITGALLSADDGDAVSILAARVLALCDADFVWVLRPTAVPGELVADVARGAGEKTAEDSSPVFAGSVERRIVGAHHAVQLDDGWDAGEMTADGRALGPVLAVPLIHDGKAAGVLLVARIHGRNRFAKGDLEMAADFAGRASVAIELAAARADRQRVALLEDRGRIARDLHDHVIQQLFATGLELQNIAGSSTEGPVTERIAQAVAHLDASISQIRTVIFALSAPANDPRATVRNSIVDLVNELAPSLARTPRVTFAGPLDLVITDDLAADVIAVTREALVNVVRHAEAQQASIDLALGEGVVTLIIADDGRGAGGTSRRSGIANLEQRALRRGGAFSFESGPQGTRVEWSVPIDSTNGVAS